jgi:hypothetical protein
MEHMVGPQMWNIRALLDMIEPAPNETHKTASEQGGFGRLRSVFAAFVSIFTQ